MFSEVASEFRVWALGKDHGLQSMLCRFHASRFGALNFEGLGIEDIRVRVSGLG